MHYRDIFSIFFNMKIYCVFYLKLPNRGGSNEYTQYTIFNIKMKITLNHPKYADMGFFSEALKNEFEPDVVNEPSVFEPLKFYCILRIVRQGPTELPVGAGGDVWTFFLYHFLLLSPCLWIDCNIV